MIDRLITEVCQVDSSPNSLIFKEIIMQKHEEKQINNCKNKYYDFNKINWDAIYIIKCLDRQLDGHVTKIDQEDHKLD